MYKLLSGAKSVKQYRGDENLPEAKKGMKKCGCKHTRSKYKYQEGERDIAADKLEYGDSYETALKNNFGNSPVVNTTVNSIAPVVNPVAVKRNVVTPKKDTVPTKKKTYSRIGGEKKIYLEKSSVNSNRNNSTEYSSRVKQYINNSLGPLIPQRDTTYSLDENTNKMVMNLPNVNKMYSKKNIGYGYEDLTPEEQKQVKYEQKLRQRNDLAKQIEVSNNGLKYRQQYPGQEKESAKNSTAPAWKMAKNVNAFTKSIEGKSGYKYGTGALAIPEGSAIVTANKGKNKLALKYYKAKKWPELNKVIEDMPEDNVDKAQVGKKKLKSSSALNYVPANQHKEKYYGKVTDADFDKLRENNPWYDWSNFDPSKEGDVKKFQGAFNKLSESLGSKARLEVDDKLGEQTATAKVDYMGEEPIPPPETIPPPDKGGDDIGKRKEFVTLPSMAEIAARSSILGQGIEGVPENYLKLGRYNYASQLPKTLQEIQLAEQTGRESARDIVGGDAGRYLAQAGSLSSARMKAANAAVVQDTLARQDILNKNVDLGNKEAEINTGLKNQYNTLRGQARSAYNDQLVALGQRVDSATETAQEMSNQRGADDQRMQILKDLGLNYEYKNVNGLIKLVPKVPTNTPAAATTTTTATTADATSKKGLKKLKTYKRN